MQLDEGPHTGQAKADAAMARADRVRLEPVEHAVDHVDRNAAALIGHLEHDLSGATQGRERDRLAGLGKADGVGQQVEENLPDALGIGAEGADVVQRDDVEMDVGFREPVLQPFRRCGDGGADVDRLQRQLHRIGVDRGEV